MMKDEKGTREGKYLGGHCSLTNIGQIYAHLLSVIPRERIIVLAQLKETLQWLREASASDEACQRMAGRASLRSLMESKIHITQSACADLLARGGADYDGEDVNPSTFLR